MNRDYNLKTLMHHERNICTDFRDAQSRRDMDKKTTSISQQQFCNVPAHVILNQEAGEKYLNPT